MYDFGPKAVQAIIKRGGLFQLNAFGFLFLMNFVLVSFYRGSPLSTNSLSTISGKVQFQKLLNSMDSPI